MKEIEKTVYEKSVFALCSLASVKWPLQLVGKKIAFIIKEGDVEVKVYDSISRVVIENGKSDKGNVSICLGSVYYPNENQMVLVYNKKENIWEFCRNIDKYPISPVEAITFETKLFGLFTI